MNRVVRGAAVAALLCVLIVGCGSDGNAPVSIDGTWCLLLIGPVCDDAPPGILNQSGTGAQVIQVSQVGDQVSAQFVDLAGASCSLSGTYGGDQFRGQVTVTDGARTVEAYVEGFARVHNGRRQVDGWFRITLDTEEQCVGEVIQFCAILDDDGVGPPVFSFIEPAAKTNVITGGSVSIIYVDDFESGVALTDFYADQDGNLATTTDQILIASQRADGNGQTQSFTWDTTGAPLGNYFIVAVTTGGGFTVTSTAIGVVCIQPLPPTGPISLIVFGLDGTLYSVDPFDAGLERITIIRDSQSSDPVGIVSSSIFIPGANPTDPGQIWIGTGGSTNRTMFPGSIFSIALQPATGGFFINGVADFLFDNRSETSGHAGLARRESDGAIFGMVGDDGAIYSVNTTTGQAGDCTQLNVGQAGNGITFIGNELIWATNNEVYTIDNLDTTPVATFFGDLVLDSAFDQFGISQYSIGSLTTLPPGLLSGKGGDGTVLGILKVDGGGGSAGTAPSFLVRLEPNIKSSNTVDVLLIGRTALLQNVNPSPVRVDGLAAVPSFDFD